MVTPGGPRTRLRDERLLVIVGEARGGRSLEEVLARVLAGGARLLQLRAKTLSKRALLQAATALAARCADAGALLLVNDHADVAVAAGAAGVHVGADDLPPAAARAVVGPARIVGATVHGAAEAEAARAAGADYAGVGTIFGSPTKPGLEPGGMALLERLVPLLGEVPAFAIGGITREHVAAVRRAGAHGVAVASAIVDADDIEGETRAFLEALGGGVGG
jgi:thiamine-phosphate pyrophosphorylase